LIEELKIGDFLYEKELPRWHKILSKGKSINGMIKDFPEDEQRSFIDKNLKSILVTPIMIHGAFWGIIGLDECRHERVWNDSEISILASVGSAIAGAIIREKTKSDLENAKKEAESSAETANKATKAKSEFLANMSHEIRTPLNGVIGMAEILTKTELNEKQKECVEDLAFSSNLLLSIINDILDFSKIEAGKLELESAPFNLKSMTKKLCRILRYQASKKGLKLNCEYSDDCPEFVVGDSVRIRQIFMNLVSNSIKFTQKGEITVKLDPLEFTKSKTTLQISVRDTGIGIAEDNIGKIFDKFTQADTSTTRKYGGTGLGLPISKLLIEKMGGEISVKSKTGEGTEFIFSIPFENADGKYFEESTEELKIFWEKQPKVMLVEDNFVNQRVAMTHIEASGCLVDLAENGLDALTKFRENSYDIIFMDVQMPVMDGFEATRILRRIEEGKTKTPIVAMTAGASSDGKDECLEAGMDDYLSKPVNRFDLNKMLIKQLSHLLGVEKTEKSSKTESQEDKSEPVFDYASAMEMMNNNEVLLKDLLKYFLDNVPENLKDLKAAITEKDSKQAERLSHTLKGMGANLSAKQFAKTALQAERDFADGKFENSEDLVLKLQNDFEDFKKAASKYL
jgi:signal transduction histidine kinase/CheY-like chemotaxis protein